MPKVTQLISEGLGLKPRQSLWGPHPYLLYHNALNASHPSATASCVWLDPNDPQKDPDRGPGYQVLNRRAGQGLGSASQQTGQQMETGARARELFSRLGWG